MCNYLSILWESCVVHGKLTVAGASGYWGDANRSTKLLLEDTEIDVLVYDYLAEITMAIMAKAKKKDPNAGYATDFIHEVMRKNLIEISQKGIKVISNAGGMNPTACAHALQTIISKYDLSLKVGVVLGDDLLYRLPELAKLSPKEMFSKSSFPKLDAVMSVNAYLGAFPIAKLLDDGVDIVVTGRCVDSAVTLAACISHFKWKPDDLDLLAAGSLVGHLLECGTQVTGGNFTDWEQIKGDFESIGYPVAKISQDGTAVISKPNKSGGIVNFGTVAEQLVYEIGDPSRYVLPDVTCDFSNVKIEEVQTNEVKVTGARGYNPPEKLKVSLTYLDGYRGGNLYGFYGIDAAKKAKAFSDATIIRANKELDEAKLERFSEKSIEILGSEAQFGRLASSENSREIFVKIAVKHPKPEGVSIMLKAATGLGLSSPPGLSGFAGTRPKPSPVLALFSFLISRDRVPITTQINQSKLEELKSPSLHLSKRNRQIIMPPKLQKTAVKKIPLLLIDLAFARSGDKGDKVNIGVISRSEDLYPFLWSVLTENKVKKIFSHFVKGPVYRYPMPGPGAINFILDRAIGGGGTSSLRNDPQGKGFSQILLATRVLVPENLILGKGLIKQPNNKMETL